MLAVRGAPSTRGESPPSIGVRLRDFPGQGIHGEDLPVVGGLSRQGRQRDTETSGPNPGTIAGVVVACIYAVSIFRRPR